MSSQQQSHILMYRPHLLNIPAVRPLPDGYVLRAFKEDDNIASLATTLTLSFEDPWSVERVRTDLTEAPDVHAVYVVTWQDTIIATTSSRGYERFPRSGYVHWVGTHPEHRGKGLAPALLARVLQDFVERDYPDAILETDDFRIPAIKTYLKFGFLPVYDVAGEDHRKRWAEILQKLF